MHGAARYIGGTAAMPTRHNGKRYKSNGNNRMEQMYTNTPNSQQYNSLKYNKTHNPLVHGSSPCGPTNKTMTYRYSVGPSSTDGPACRPFLEVICHERENDPGTRHQRPEHGDPAPAPPTGTDPSDRCSQYRAILQKNGLVASMSRNDNCCDNAPSRCNGCLPLQDGQRGCS